MKRANILLTVSIFFCLFAAGLGPATRGAAAPPPPDTPDKDAQRQPWERMPFPAAPQIRLRPADFALATADHFGYTWDDTQPLNWIDATGGTRLAALDGQDDQASPAIKIGFNFKFYENSYDSLYVSANGFLTFITGDTSLSGEVIPQTAAPNNLIAPLWQDLAIGGA